MALHENDIARWQRLYGAAQKLKEVILPAYQGTVAPIISSLIPLVSSQGNCNLVTVGGGNGSYSRYLHDKVTALVTGKNPTQRISVTETDYTSIVRTAPCEKTLVMDATRLSTYFKTASIDLLVGESMFHQLKYTGGRSFLKQANQCLSAKGMFIHVQDAIPDPRDYFPQATVTDLIGHEQAAVAHTSDAHAEAMKKLQIDSHGIFLNYFANTAKEMGFYFLAFTNDNSVVVPKVKPFNQVIASCDLDQVNSIKFHFGAFLGENDPSVPKDQVKVSYESIISICSKDIKASALAKLIESN